VINRAYREAQVAIERTAMVRDIRERAKTQAEKVLCEFSKSLGWGLDVRWGD
jgi:hypothetical protein